MVALGNCSNLPLINGKTEDLYNLYYIKFHQSSSLQTEYFLFSINETMSTSSTWYIFLKKKNLVDERIFNMRSPKRFFFFKNMYHYSLHQHKHTTAHCRRRKLMFCYKYTRHMIVTCTSRCALTKMSNFGLFLYIPKGILEIQQYES